jgi:pimeloyl-ACP methyl ester carboxylesterase
MTAPHVAVWGAGEPVLFVHGSVSAGEEGWFAQRPLAEAGFELRVMDRRGYGATPGDAEDYLADADDIAALLGDGAHLVSHSYGGVGSLLAAARRPEAVRSLAVVEPPLFGLAPADGPAGEMARELERFFAGSSELTNREFLLAFLRTLGEDPSPIPDHMIDAWAAAGVRALRNVRPSWTAELPLEQLAAAPFPKLVFSGGQSAAFDAVCDTLAESIGARRQVIEGWGHSVALTGEPFNRALLEFWGAT